MFSSRKGIWFRIMPNRVCFMDGGYVIEDGTPEEVFKHPKSDRAKQFFSKILNV